MREIKFRGQSVDNEGIEDGQLIYGYLCAPDQIIVWDEKKKVGSCYQVDPKTVGQFTNRKDKNKKEVYDKHILKTPGNQRMLVEIDNLIDGDGKFRSILIEECEIIGTEQQNNG